MVRAASVESGTWGSDAVIQSGIEVGRDGHGLIHPAEDWLITALLAAALMDAMRKWT